jgi:hypothetical protein
LSFVATIMITLAISLTQSHQKRIPFQTIFTPYDRSLRILEDAILSFFESNLRADECLIIGVIQRNSKIRYRWKKSSSLLPLPLSLFQSNQARFIKAAFGRSPSRDIAIKLDASVTRYTIIYKSCTASAKITACGVRLCPSCTKKRLGHP